MPPPRARERARPPAAALNGPQVEASHRIDLGSASAAGGGGVGAGGWIQEAAQAPSAAGGGGGGAGGGIQEAAQAPSPLAQYADAPHTAPGFVCVTVSF